MTKNAARRPRLTDEGGFTLAIAMGILLIASIVSVAAFQAANGDLTTSADDSDRRVAYEAAESGIAWYQAKLTGDPDYWQKCATITADPVNQPTVAAGSRKWRALSGSGTSLADFSLGMLPASGTTCNTADPAGSMLDAVDGSFRVRSTGRYRGQLRSVIGTFKRQRFLDFLYFTDYETLDYTINGGDPACARYRALRPSSCTVIQFADADQVNGPLHTNDDLVVCGTPTFGRTPADKINVSGPAPGYRANTGCTAAPDFKGTFLPAQRALQMPPTNTQLKDLTTPGFGGLGYRLYGTQYIRFNGNGTMTVDTPAGNPQNVSLPSNGVIYVDDAGCSNPGNDSIDDMSYTEGSGCANVYVSGTADQPVTVASYKDIIVAPTTSYVGTDTSKQFNPATAGSSWSDADLEASGTLSTTTQQVSGTVQVGLIANGFVRVYHRISGGLLASGVRNVRIDAAMLSLQHSFIVDNWNQGPSPGSLTVHGAIAQRFRGPVGTGSGGGISTGYVKDYWYDNRLRFRSPPNFLDPVNSAWSLSRLTELVPPV